MFHILLLFTFHWPELTYMAKCNYKGGQEMPSLAVWQDAQLKLEFL